MDLDYLLEDGTGIDTVRSVLSDFLPDIRFHHIDKQMGRLMFETIDGIVPLRSLSDGYQSAAAWIGDLLYRVTEVFEDYKSPLEARGLLLIDEVDLHLHPNWQRQLLSFLGTRLPNFQVIVTTHSPMTAQQANRGELFYLTREHRRVRIDQFTGNPRDLLISQLLMTDAFGLESDESLELQEMKDQYRRLRDQEQLSPQEKATLSGLTKALAERPFGIRSNLQLKEEQVELLLKIEEELERAES
jgi:hypothetical protein